MRGKATAGSQCEKRSSRRKRLHSWALARRLPKVMACSASLPPGMTQPSQRVYYVCQVHGGSSSTIWSTLAFRSFLKCCVPPYSVGL